MRVRRVRIGKREVFTRGLAPGVWGDVFHSAMTASWPVFLAWLTVAFVATNAVFALLFSLQEDSVANAGGALVRLFYFSVETLATVGYGEMYPHSQYGYFIVSVETFVGMFFSASMLGLIFARVSRPTARLLFAKSLTIGPYDGQTTLSVRVANARLNMISSATARLWVLMSQRTAENVTFRRFLELNLVRSENPTFVLSWTILHTIDEASPLYGRTPAELRDEDAFLILSISGHDETSAQMVHARETYYVNDIKWDHRYVDVLTTTEGGSTLLDYEHFHDVEPVPLPSE